MDDCNITYINNYTCKYCNQNYFLDQTQTCLSINLISNCNIFDYYGCTECKTGYYLVSHFCSITNNCLKVYMSNSSC